jgi:hypothetical protein
MSSLCEIDDLEDLGGRGPQSSKASRVSGISRAFSTANDARRFCYPVHFENFEI